MTSEAETLRFLDTLARHQINDADSDFAGSFLLAPRSVGGGTGREARWSTAPLHTDGASFHACHIADVLLHRFGVMNCWYLYSVTKDPEFRIMAARHAWTEIDGFAARSVLESLDARDPSLVLRAVCYGACSLTSACRPP